MPALGDHIKIETDEIGQPARAYTLDCSTSTKKTKNMKSATKTNNGIKNDMFRRRLVHFAKPQYTGHLLLLKFWGGGGLRPLSQMRTQIRKSRLLCIR